MLLFSILINTRIRSRFRLKYKKNTANNQLSFKNCNSYLLKRKTNSLCLPKAKKSSKIFQTIKFYSIFEIRSKQILDKVYDTFVFLYPFNIQNSITTNWLSSKQPTTTKKRHEQISNKQNLQFIMNTYSFSYSFAHINTFYIFCSNKQKQTFFSYLKAIAFPSICLLVCLFIQNLYIPKWRVFAQWNFFFLNKK